MNKTVMPATAGIRLFLKRCKIPAFAGMTLLLLSAPALAQTLSLDLGQEGDGSVTGRIVQMLALLTVLSLAPSILIMMTSFTRIIVVLSFLRTAIGVQQTPPNTVMISLAMFLTFFIMAPTLQSAYETGIKPLIAQEIDEVQAFEKTIIPFKAFMLKHAKPRDLELFLGLSETPPPEDPMATPIQVVIPAFMISELQRAFEIGFMLFLPFLVIDLVTASILMAMGMMMLPPVTVSLPFKIIFFVLADGWYLIAGSLIQSFDIVPLPRRGETMDDSKQSYKSRLRWSLKTAFWIYCSIVAFATFLTFLLSNKDLWLQLEIVVAVIMSTLFLFYWTILYNGISFDENEELKFEFIKLDGAPIELPLEGAAIPFGQFAQHAGCITSFFVLLIIDIVAYVFLVMGLLFVLWFGVWLGLNVAFFAITLIALPLFYIFSSSVHFVTKNSAGARGNLLKSAWLSASFSFFKTVWMALLIAGVHYTKEFFL